MDECIGLLNAPDERAWFESLVGTAGKLGYNQVLYGLKPNKQARNDEAVILSTFPGEWRHHYDSQGYATIDPTVAHSFTSSLPLRWHRALYSTQAAQAFAEEAKGAGLSHGITLPIHGPQGQVGMLSLSCDALPEREYEQLFNSGIGQLAMLRDYAFTSAVRHLQPAKTPAPHLTTREREILHWAWAEKTTWEIGKILSLSGPTVEFHFKNIRRKLNVNSRRLAVARAIQLDLLNV
ncbi:autoinducer binding domain-containing protein [Pseudomonas sp. NPDC090233]|uniref:helix-turn-helix transcriptional regulator n=1 Tax=Pseudomonas sp. NPDC090233 TaxID=3364479 RepID=UPI00383A8C18